jgi:hypothetical protein
MHQLARGQRYRDVAQPVGTRRAEPLRDRRGNKMIDDAKIGGITPAMFSLSGRNELWP